MKFWSKIEIVEKLRNHGIDYHGSIMTLKKLKPEHVIHLGTIQDLQEQNLYFRFLAIFRGGSRVFSGIFIYPPRSQKSKNPNFAPRDPR